MSHGQRATHPPRTRFTDTGEIAIGATVFDRDFDMPGTVRDVDGLFVEVGRPTGFVWRVYHRGLRPATDREERQLAAIGRLHRQRQRGLGRPG